ncbi:hypothetical protein Vretimale_3975, partial [Volvox reticuliferus]
MRAWAPHPQASPTQWPICHHRVIIRNKIVRTTLAYRPCLGHDTPSPAHDDLNSLGARVGALLVSALSSCAIILSSSLPALAADSLTIKFRASRNPEIRAAQEVLVQAWGVVRERYVDASFNKQDWDQQLQAFLAATQLAATRDEALQQVPKMLQTLGDPYTRVLLQGGGDIESFQALKQAKVFSTG